MARLQADAPERGVRIHPLHDPTTGIWVGGDSINKTNQSKGSVRHYAGGVRRAITWGAVDRNATANLPLGTVDHIDRLESWIDRVVVLRSVRGEVLAGLLSTVNTNARPEFPEARISCNVSIMTTTEDGSV